MMIFDFGYRLKDLRERKNLTQSQVAARLGVSKASISGYENNVKTPSLAVLTRLASFYSVSTDYLLGLESRRMLPINGLSSSQEEIMRRLLAEFRDANQHF